MEGLKEIWSKTLTYNSKRHLPGLQAAITSQQQIGWWVLISRRWSLHWKEIQHHYLQVILSKKLSQRWQANIIQLLWDTAWDLWEFQNDIEHRNDNTNTNEQNKLLHQEIRRQWNLGAPAHFEHQYF